MLKLSVPDMTCSHCAGVVEKAVKSVDPSAGVAVDFSSRVVSIETKADVAAIASAIETAGYPTKAA